MSEIAKAGDTIPIRVLLFDGENPLEDRTVSNLTIERLSDHKYWTGSAWQTDHVTVSMTEKTGNIHYEGVYEYDFTTESTPNTYDWSVKYEEAGSAYRRRFRGRISTEWTHLTDALGEVSGLIGATATPVELFSLMLAILRNDVTVTDSVAKVHNSSDEAQMDMALSDDGTTFKKSKATAS